MMYSNPNLQIRPTSVSDLDQLFLFQTDPEAIYLAAFTLKDPTDKPAYITKYTKILSDPTTNNHTILLDDVIVGSVSKYMMDGHAEITYWINRKFWGQGLASRALNKFLDHEKTRPLFGRAAFDNFASQKVLEKCGFIKTGTDKGFANGRETEVEEIIYQLT